MKIQPYLLILLFLFSACSKEDSPNGNTQAIIKFELSVNSTEGGSVNTSGGTYNQNSEVTITATPQPGYTFTGWSGNATGSSNPLTISMNGDKTITANFTRITFGLDVGIIGEGTVEKEVISSSKTDEYNQGTVVRLNAVSNEPWLFIDWTGSSTATTNQIDLTIDSSKAVTATFEERINQVLNDDNLFNGVGKWKIRRPPLSNKTQNCQVLEIIFQSNNSFKIITSSSTITGQFSVDSNSSISLIQQNSSIGQITNLVLTNSYISFTLNLSSICDENIDGDRDEDYNESLDSNRVTYIPDNNFEQALIDNGYDDQLDNYIQTSIAKTIDRLDLRRLEITSSQGIEDFTALEYLNLYENQLGAIDLTNNINLVTLFLGRNQLNTIDLSQNVLLEFVQLNENLIDALDVSNNISLSTLFAQSNNLSEVDLSQNINLTQISFAKNNLSFLDLSQNENIEYINLQGFENNNINLTQLNVSNINDLVYLYTEGSNLLCIVLRQEQLDNIPVNGNWTKNESTVYTTGCTEISLAENGVTVLCPNSTPGDIGVLNGKTYEVVDNSMLIEKVESGEDLSCLCTSNVNNMSNLFNNNTSFNQDISSWDVSQVENMSDMFSGASEFNQDIGNWNIGNVINMSGMFSGASQFNQDIGRWNTSNVVYMTRVFNEALEFNQDLNDWDTSSVVQMGLLFRDANSFNQNLNNWDTSNVTNMSFMFSGARSFNLSIESWDTSQVTNMDAMFQVAEVFNQSLSNWNVSNVTSMNYMFYGAGNMNQNLSSWCVQNIPSEPEFFVGFNSTLEQDNFPLWGTCPGD